MTIDPVWLKAKIKEVKDIFADGFQFGDLLKAANLARDVSKELKELKDKDHRQVAVEIINGVIDATDTPWLPDSMTDPIFKMVAPWAVDKAFDAVEGVLGKDEKSDES